VVLRSAEDTTVAVLRCSTDLDHRWWRIAAHRLPEPGTEP
jgi:hypothetical protein